jgi:hypothetical protein
MPLPPPLAPLPVAPLAASVPAIPASSSPLLAPLAAPVLAPVLSPLLAPLSLPEGALPLDGLPLDGGGFPTFGEPEVEPDEATEIGGEGFSVALQPTPRRAQQ